MTPKKIDRIHVMSSVGTIRIFAATEMEQAEKYAFSIRGGGRIIKVKTINEYVADDGEGWDCRPSQAEAFLKKHRLINS